MALLPATAALAQGVGIGTTISDSKAALDITASGKGLLIPRMGSATRVAIGNSGTPSTGLLMFQIGSTSPRTRTGFYYYGGGAWLYLPDKATSGDDLGDHTATQALKLGAYALTGTGDNLPTNVVGISITAKGGLNIGQYNSGTSPALAQNIFIDYQAGQYNTFGTSPTVAGRPNHLVGYQAGNNNTTASNNQFDGYKAGYLNTTGHGNLAVGNSALYTNQQNSYNTAIGF